MAGHSEGVGRTRTAAQNRFEGSVESGKAGLTPPSCTAGRTARAGASSGRPTSYTHQAPARVPHGLSALQDWRITCFFGDGAYRQRCCLHGARRCSAPDRRARGGTAESYPEGHRRPAGLCVIPSQHTVALFERHGFERTRRLGKHHLEWTKASRTTGVHFQNCLPAPLVVICGVLL